MRERVQPFQLGVDEARMAHDQAAIRQPGEEARKNLCEIIRAFYG